MRYLGSHRFWGAGVRARRAELGVHHRWVDEAGHVWELRVWEGEEAIKGDEDEAPVVLCRDGEPVAEYGSVEEFKREEGWPME